MEIGRPDGSVWLPSPVEVDRIWHALQELRFRPVMARLAQVRRHGKGGGL